MTELFPESFTTDRLLFERVCRENVAPPELYRIRGQDDDIEEIAEYLPWEPHESPNETAALLEKAEAEWEAGDAARYVLRPKPSEEEAGVFAGYAKLEIDWERRTGELGVWFRKSFWGRGYSVERADALLTLAFERLSLDLVVATHQVGNENSRRAIEKYVRKYGGQHDGRLRNWQVTADGVVDVHRYTITAEQYRDNATSDDRFNFSETDQ